MPSLKTDDIVRGVLDLAKTSQELEGVKKEIDELKQSKGQLERDINLLKRVRADEQMGFNKEKLDREKEKREINSVIEDLQHKRAMLINSTAPEVAKLEDLKVSTNSAIGVLNNKQEELNKQAEQIGKNQQSLEEKKKILKQIIELTKSL